MASAIGAIAGWWRINRGWPVLRTAQYLALVAEFEGAREIPARSGGAGWEFDLPISGGRATAKITGGSALSAVRIMYSDETAERPLYGYRDYSSPRSIKAAGGIVFVCWTETLFGSDTWVLAYDLDARREITRQRVVPEDVGL